MSYIRDGLERKWLNGASLVLSGGPAYSREALEDDPPYVPPSIRLGFAPPPVAEPLTWEGDEA